jgi:acetyltransferase-like isoleucine patch superfamily enzyme
MQIIPGSLIYSFNYYVRFRGNLINYLRHQGVRIGEHCQLLNIADNYGSEPWLIEIGNHVTLTSGVFLLTHDASSRLFRKTLPQSSPYGNRFGRIRIHDNCFVGVNSIILPGVTIGPNSIVGAGSVVAKDVHPNAVVAGVPARVICTLDDYIEKYKERMIPIKSINRDDLRRELTLYFWGEER